MPMWARWVGVKKGTRYTSPVHCPAHHNPEAGRELAAASVFGTRDRSYAVGGSQFLTRPGLVAIPEPWLVRPRLVGEFRHRHRARAWRRPWLFSRLLRGFSRACCKETEILQGWHLVR